MKVAPDEAIHVGDAPHLDITGANAAGIKSILIRRDKPAGEPNPIAGNVVSSFDEIVAMLRSRI